MARACSVRPAACSAALPLAPRKRYLDVNNSPREGRSAAMSGPRRVIVGASGSPGNLCALRYAEYLARATGATLIPVHAWIPPGGDVADRRCPSFYLRRVWTED